MGFHHRPQPSGPPKVAAVLVLLFLLVVTSAEQLSSAAPGRARDHRQSPAEVPTQPERLSAFDAYLPSKRRVPNASDPIHNR